VARIMSSSRTLRPSRSACRGSFSAEQSSMASTRGGRFGAVVSDRGAGGVGDSPCTAAATFSAWNGSFPVKKLRSRSGTAPRCPAACSTSLRGHQLLGGHVRRGAHPAVVLVIPWSTGAALVSWRYRKSKTLMHDEPPPFRAEEVGRLRSRCTMPRPSGGPPDCLPACRQVVRKTSRAASVRARGSSTSRSRPRSSSITMYGAPGRKPTKSSRAQRARLDLDRGARPRARSARPPPRVANSSGQQDVMAPPLVSTTGCAATDHAHTDRPRNASRAVLQGQQLSLGASDWRQKHDNEWAGWFPHPSTDKL